MKRITAASLIALGALTLTACSDTHQMLSTGPDSITVSGNGEIAAQPDIFRVAATAREQGDDIAAMKSRVDDAVADMLDLADDLTSKRNRSAPVTCTSSHNGSTSLNANSSAMKSAVT